MQSRTVALSLALVSILTFASAVRADRLGQATQGKTRYWSVADLYASSPAYALGHRGYGADVDDPAGPHENSLDAFHQAFQDGIRVIELDLQRTADGKVVVFHDDYLSDFTCVSSLTYEELLVREPQAPLFRSVLNSNRHFGGGDCLSGVLFAEIKVPVPLCDGANTSKQAEV